MDDLKPATSEEFFKALSDYEFRNMLSAWFEEKGIVSDLRSQLRFKMIHVLKNTAIGRDISKKTSQSTSLSRQAINLIVADHLLRNHYQFSLSIFCTEASVMNVFPEYPTTIDCLLKPHCFEKENVVKILDLVGVSNESWISNEIINMYYSSEDSLLTCLFQFLNKTTLWTGSSKFKTLDLTNDPLIIKHLANLLREYDQSFNSYKRILDHIKKIYLTEMERIQRSQRDQLYSLKRELKSKEKKIANLNKLRKSLEHNLKQLYTELEQIKNKAVEKIEPEAKIDTQMSCKLLHCTELCRQHLDIIQSLSAENKNLVHQNMQQKERINQLSRKYENLSSSLNEYKNKVLFLRTRIIEEESKSCDRKATSDTDSSDHAIEKVIQEARLKLKMLADENKRIEQRCLS